VAELTEEQIAKQKSQNQKAFYLLGGIAILGAILLFGWYQGWWF
jgi:hypothetical protein